MNAKLSIFLITFLMLIIPLQCSTPPSITAQGAILIEPKTNTILFQKNAYTRFYPASTTKLLTTLILLEELDLNTTISKTKNAVQIVPSDSSHIALNIGDTYSAYNGLYGILLGSDNFIAHDMAVKCAGSIPRFSDKMNQKAKSLGALDSHFVNSHGYHDPNHYTTAYDLSQIAKGAFNNSQLTEIAGTASYPFKVLNKNKTLTLQNTSRLLKTKTSYYNAHVVACKTGYHSDAQQTLVAKAVYDDIELIAVVLKTNTPHQYEDINALFTYGSTYFSTSTVDGEHYVLKNHTYSEWFKPYVEHALTNNWLTTIPSNYGDAISISAFSELLMHPINDQLSKDLSLPLVDLSAFTSLERLTRKKAAEIVYSLHNQLTLTPTYYSNSPYIPDIAHLSANNKEAIQFMASTQLLGSKDKPFYPDQVLSYEQALCLTYRFEKLLIKRK